MKQSIIGVVSVAVLAALSGCSGQGEEWGADVETTSQNLIASSMPAARFNMASAVFNDSGVDKLIVVGGESAAGTEENDIFIYDPSVDTWTTLNNEIGAGPAQIPTLTRAKLVPVPTSDKLLLIGGFDGTNVVNTVYSYDFGDDQWTQLANMTNARVDFAASPCGSGDNVIVVGGSNNAGTELAAVEVYDLSANMWSNPVNLRDKRANFGFSSNDNTFEEFIVSGGQDNAAELSTVELISASSACASMTRVVATNSGVDINIDQRKDLVTFREGSTNTFIVSAGDDSGTNEPDSYRVQVTDWTGGTGTVKSAALSPALTTARREALAVQYRSTGRFAVVGGVSAGAASEDAVQIYNPATDAFAAELDLSVARRSFSTEYLPSEDLAIVAGGINAAGTVLSSVESL